MQSMHRSTGAVNNKNKESRALHRDQSRCWLEDHCLACPAPRLTMLLAGSPSTRTQANDCRPERSDRQVLAPTSDGAPNLAQEHFRLALDFVQFGSFARG